MPSGNKPLPEPMLTLDLFSHMASLGYNELILVQAVGCHLFGTKPLPEPVSCYSLLDISEQISVKFESNQKHFH